MSDQPTAGSGDDRDPHAASDPGVHRDPGTATGDGMGNGRGNGSGDGAPLRSGAAGTEAGRRLVVPGPTPSANHHDEETERQLVQDLGSASRSCMAIIVVLLVIALVTCVFLFWAFVIA